MIATAHHAGTLKFISGTALIAAVLAAILRGPVPAVAALLLLLLVVALWEAQELVTQSSIPGLCLGTLCGAVILLAPLSFAMRLSDATMLWLFFMVGSIAVALQATFHFPHSPARSWAFGACTGLFIAGMLTGLWFSKLPHGRTQLALAIWLAWTGDLAAGVVWRRFMTRRHPLWAWASPRKDWEGVANGALGMSLSGPLFWTVTGRSIPLSRLWLVIVAVIVTRPVGDLLESALKRLAGVADSGTLKLLPGHGGVLDRIDSIVLTLPVVYLIIAS
jgi:phosphatidate cytidylyltransferase